VSLSATSLLSVLDEWIEAATGGTPRLAPLLPFDPDDVSPAATKAFDRIQAATPTAQETLRKKFETAFGFDKGLRQGEGRCIWEPWRGMKKGDLEAVIKVADMLGVPPAQVLALWIAEGKYHNNAELHGASGSAWVIAEDDVTLEQVRSWLRSQILFAKFGADSYSSFGTSRTDNSLDGPEGKHDAAFNRIFAKMKAQGVKGIAQGDVDDVRAYFTEPAGAISAKFTDTEAKKPLGAAVPNDTSISADYTLRRNSIASWLYLQHGMFLTFQKDLELKFDDEYGPGMDLRGDPWATYLVWNGGIGQYDFKYKGYQGTPEDRLKELYGDPPAHTLPSGELNLYYKPDGSRSALGNAVQFKYLVKSVEPWFAP
jgi:hypothetical protein